MTLKAGFIGRRGFYVGPPTFRLSCHVNGYGHGSQAALCVGDKWYGWWSEHGWSVRDQKPLRLTVSVGERVVFDDYVGDAPLTDTTIVVVDETGWFLRDGRETEA